MTCRGVVDSLAVKLGAAGLESPRIEAERLVSGALGVPRHELFLNPDLRISQDQQAIISGLLLRRVSGEPLQYIEGSASFRGLELEVSPGVLVPRPETEQLVDHVAEWIRELRSSLPVDRALDIGTGSGALALALASERLARFVVALDVSETALTVARTNVKALGAEHRLQLRRASSDFWAALSQDERFGLIVSNPPYITDDEFFALPDDVRFHEPRVALAGGPEGLDVIRRVAAGGPDRLEPSGALFMEIGAEQGSSVHEILKRDDRWHRVSIDRDLAGRDRFAIAIRR